MKLFGHEIEVKKAPKKPVKQKAGKAKKKKTETSKLLAYWSVAIATICLVIHYTLTAFGLEPAAELTVAVFTACIGYLITYAGKSLGEKCSRNKHGLDANGQPYSTASAQEEDHP